MEIETERGRELGRDEERKTKEIFKQNKIKMSHLPTWFSGVRFYPLNTLIPLTT